ncbi:B-4DMT family transporter [Nocardia acididurans]|nr:B-4DMT family transporter [Nocardia acididurans]
MNAWVLRAVGLGALTVVLRTVLGFAMVYLPTAGSWLRILCLIVLLAAVITWGVLDGQADRRANADPDRGADLTMRWLYAGLAGGLGSGVVAWILDFVPKFDLGDNGLLFEVTSAASFIILLIFVPAVAGVALGRYLVSRNGEKSDGAADTVVLNKETAGV